MVDPNGFLMIEPEGQDTKPVIDEITRKVAAALKTARKSEYGYRGFHTCRCGVLSDNYDYFVTIDGKEYTTNFLAVHYAACHRAEIPTSQLALIQLLTEEREPTRTQIVRPFKQDRQNAVETEKIMRSVDLGYYGNELT